MEVVEMATGERFKQLVTLYSKSAMQDMYGSGFVGEVISQACLAKGYNPIGAGLAIEELLKNARN